MRPWELAEFTPTEKLVWLFALQEKNNEERDDSLDPAAGYRIQEELKRACAADQAFLKLTPEEVVSLGLELYGR